jgi:hypothetical protein
VLFDRPVADEGVVEIVEGCDYLPVAAGEGRLAGRNHRSGAVDGMRGLVPAITELRDRAVPAGGALEEIRDELGINQWHITGDDERVGPGIERAQSSPDASHRALVGIVVDSELDRTVVARERRLDGLALVRPAVEDESVDSRTDSIGDPPDHRRAGEIGRGLIALTEARRSTPGDDDSRWHPCASSPRVKTESVSTLQSPLSDDRSRTHGTGNDDAGRERFSVGHPSGRSHGTQRAQPTDR